MSYERYCELMRLEEMIELPMSALKVYLHLLHMNRGFGKNGILNVSDSELKSRTHLSQQTITDAKRILKNKGFIDFESSKGLPTRYQMKLYYELEKAEHQVEHQVENSPVHPNNSNNINNNKLLPPPPPPPPRVREQVEDLEERLRQITRAANELSQSLATLKSPQVVHYPEVEHCDALDKVIAEWESRPKFAPLDFPQMSRLQNYLAQYSFEELKAAMDTASLTNKATGRYDGVSFIYFERVLERMNKPKTKPKGEVKNERTNSPSYSAPERNGASRWRKYASGADNGTDSGEEKGIRIDAAG